MKLFKVFFVAIISLSLFAFTSEITKEVNTETSVVKWTGYKVTGQHEGTIMIKKGSLTFEDNLLVGGKFIIDMSTINTTDLEGDYKKKLDGHLKDDDFFGVEKHKTASLVFTSLKQNGAYYIVNADLTIKGITNKVKFKMQVSENSATADLKIDRTKFDIKYGSASFFDDLKDRSIYDEFDLNVNLSF
ncbi:MAG: YceI family protein [Bacteroidetes bacterium]|nr:YceI family protein [Bacteroidota bacterium]MDA0860525.1 YceI family protein [Bacteroidota bacterium]MDA1318737.1 YceI family protein [Bacteroidota bacterium]